MDKVFCDLQMATSTKALSTWVNRTASALTRVKVEQLIRVVSNKD